MKVNGIEIIGSKFAYDGCHKIYIIEDEVDERKALELGYDIFAIDELEDTWNNSCELRFIRNWKLNKDYVKQFENATFEY